MTVPQRPQLDPATREALQARLRFYRDLGIHELYRQPVDPALYTQAEPPAPQARIQTRPQAPPQPGQGSRPDRQDQQPQPSALFSDLIPSPSQEPEIARRASAPPSFIPPPRDPVPSAQHFTALKLIREEIGDCTRCQLSKGRNKLVFGDGDPNAELMFVGEGPGADEDAQGLPFVGRGGQLLNNMIAAMGLKREQVYIANVVKCRPPQNRTPEPDEAHTCVPFLFQQIDVVRPKVIVALGQTAVTYLTGEKRPLSGWRGVTHPFRNASKLIVTYHPAFLLRDPNQKKHAWADLQIAMRELGLERPAKSQS